MEEDQFARRKRLLEEETEEKLHEENVKKFKEQKRPAKRKNQHQTEGTDRKRRKVLAIGGEASHQQTSLMVHVDGKYNTKAQDFEEPAEKNIIILRRRMEAEKGNLVDKNGR